MEKYLFAILIFPVSKIYSQTITPDIKSTSGNHYQNANIQVSFTIGEPLTATLNSSSNKLTQGFHQTEIVINTIEEIGTNHVFNYFPVPANNLIRITSSDLTQNCSVNLFSVLSIQLIEQDLRNGFTELDLSTIPTGTYVLQIKNDQNKIISQKTISIIH